MHNGAAIKRPTLKNHAEKSLQVCDQNYIAMPTTDAFHDFCYLLWFQLQLQIPWAGQPFGFYTDVPDFRVLCSILDSSMSPCQCGIAWNQAAWVLVLHHTTKIPCKPHIAPPRHPRYNYLPNRYLPCLLITEVVDASGGPLGVRVGGFRAPLTPHWPAAPGNCWQPGAGKYWASDHTPSVLQFYKHPDPLSHEMLYVYRVQQAKSAIVCSRLAFQNNALVLTSQASVYFHPVSLLRFPTLPLQPPQPNTGPSCSILQTSPHLLGLPAPCTISLDSASCRSGFGGRRALGCCPEGVYSRMYCK